MSTFIFGVRSVVHGDEPIQAKVTDYAEGECGLDACQIASVTIGPEYGAANIVFQGDPEALVAFVDRIRNDVLRAVVASRQAVSV